MAASKLQALWNHPAGPKTTLLSKILARAASFPYESLGHGYGFRFTKFRSEIEQIKKRPLRVQNVHFWAPTFKWGISIANVADFSKPPEKLSYPQQIAVTCTGIIWSRYSTVITPKNWNLFSVNVAMATTGLYQLSRKIRHDYFSEPEAAVANDD